MGLDTTHDCWHGAYSSFGHWRQAVLEASGGVRNVSVARAEDGDIFYHIEPVYPQRCFYGWWDEDFPYADPLEVLLIHSDCEGYVFPKDMQGLIDRLEGLLPNLDVGELWHSPRGKAEQFIDGLKAALNEWEIVRFH